MRCQMSHVGKSCLSGAQSIETRATLAPMIHHHHHHHASSSPVDSATSASCSALIRNQVSPRHLAKWSSTERGASDTDMHEFSSGVSGGICWLRLLILSEYCESWGCWVLSVFLMRVHAEPRDLAKWSSTEPDAANTHWQSEHSVFMI